MIYELPLIIETRRGLGGVWEAKADFTLGWWTPTTWNNIRPYEDVKVELVKLNGEEYRVIWAKDEEDKMREMC